MKDLFLIPIILAVFIFAYFIMRKAGRFIDESRRRSALEKRDGHAKLMADSARILASRSKKNVKTEQSNDKSTLKSGYPDYIE